MYFTMKLKICGGKDEMDMAGFDQNKYSRSSAKCRRTVICRITVHQNPNKDENQSEMDLNKINNDQELTELSSCSKRNDSPNTATYL